MVICLTSVVSQAQLAVYSVYRWCHVKHVVYNVSESTRACRTVVSSFGVSVIICSSIGVASSASEVFTTRCRLRLKSYGP